jgi:hypothetical protein
MVLVVSLAVQLAQHGSQSITLGKEYEIDGGSIISSYRMEFYLEYIGEHNQRHLINRNVHGHKFGTH